MNLSEVQIPPLRNSSWRSRYYGRNDKKDEVGTVVRNDKKEGGVTAEGRTTSEM